MYKRYFRWKDANAGSNEWIEMTGKEYYRFVTDPQNEGRYFTDLGDVVLECTKAKYKKFKSEDDHSSYVLEQEDGWITQSLECVARERGINSDELVADMSQGVEDQAIAGMVPLPSHSLKQWGQLGEILGGVRFPERGANRGPVLPPKPGEVVSNTGSNDVTS